MLRSDLDSKMSLYAIAGVPEAWVIDLERWAIRLFRDPDASRYHTTFYGSDSARPAALEDVALSVETVFPA